MKKWINIKMDTWQNGGLRKMDNLPVHNTPNPHPPKMDVLPKAFLQIILAAKWLVQHSSTFPKQQRRPFPSLLSVSSSICAVQGRQLLKNSKMCFIPVKWFLEGLVGIILIIHLLHLQYQRLKQ